jgi:hypothetical protein
MQAQQDLAVCEGLNEAQELAQMLVGGGPFVTSRSLLHVLRDEKQHTVQSDLRNGLCLVVRRVQIAQRYIIRNTAH